METIVVTEWLQDDHNGIFPVGARDKQMLWAPEAVNEPLKPKWPYLFKESIRAYPDQFWAEIIAYIVAKHLGFDVPAAYPAEKEIDGDIVAGALIEWMYEPRCESLVHAGDLFKQVIPEFDSELGKHHNIEDMCLLLRAVAQRTGFSGNVQEWLCDMSLYDALIGNTDRHQENWGFIFKYDVESNKSSVRMSPLYDNGTSLGHERFVEKVASWNDEALDRYISRGCHHLRYQRVDTKTRIPLMFMVEAICSERSTNRERLKNKLDALDLTSVLEEIETLTRVENVMPLSVERFNWISRVLTRRYQTLIKLLSKMDSEKP